MIIALAGRKGSGKTTASEVFLKHGYTPISFAEPLKRIVNEAFGIPLSILNDPHAKENFALTIEMDDCNLKKLLEAAAKYYEFSEQEKKRVLEKAPRTLLKTPRHVLQYVGTDLFRNCVSTTFWLDIFKLKVKPGVDYVCDDCRFPNEAELINKLQGKLVLIKRPGIDNSDTHASEKVDQLPYDYMITNYDIEQYKASMDLIAKTMRTSGTQVEGQKRS